MPDHRDATERKVGTTSLAALNQVAAFGTASRLAELNKLASGVLADKWRTDLLASADLFKTASLVSKSMSKVMAAQTLAALTQLQRPRIDLALQRSLNASALALSKKFAESLKPIALTASLDWAQRFREWGKRQRKLEAQLRRYGWSIAPSWAVDDVQIAADIGREEGKRALDREICFWYRERRCSSLRRMVDDWMSEPAFKARRPIIMDAVRDHAAGRYRVAIPTLLPLVEGIAFEVFDPGLTLTNRATNPKAAIKAGLAAEELHRLLAEAMLNVLTVLWDWVPFETARPMERTLNRHLILHGRTIRYGTEANSVKVFLTLDHLASAVRTKRDRDRKKTAA